MKRFFTKAHILLIIVIFAFCSYSAVYAGDDNISGTLTKSDDDIVLTTDNGTYTLIGKTVPESLVGKKVKINGTILDTEDEDSKVISVESFTELK